MPDPSCTLGPPISANDMYVPVARGKLVKSRKYRAWIERNLPVMSQMRPAERFPIVVSISIAGGRGWSGNSDADNAVKPIIDLLKRANVVPDDTTRYIERVEVRYYPFPSKGEALAIVSYQEPEEEPPV